MTEKTKFLKKKYFDISSFDIPLNFACLPAGRDFDI
jgi:hypothetical protein